MHVVFSVGSLIQADGGPSRSVPSLCNAVIASGATAEIVTCSSDGPIIDTLSSIQVHEVRYRNRVLRSLWGGPFKRALERCVREHAVELVHDNGVWLQTNHAAAEVARKRSLPLIISPRGMLEPWSLGQRVLRKRLAWRVFQKSDLESAAVLHATSAMEAENLRRLGLRQPITIIPNGIETFDGEHAAEDHRTNETRQAVFLSRIHPKKGLLDLVKAWSVVRPPSWRVIVAGPDEGGHKAVVVDAVRSAGLQDVFEFVGSVAGARKRELLCGADLFVLPTSSENFGLVIGEALAAGTPVITTKGTPWGELETRRCGWWTDVGTYPLIEALRQAVALSDEERTAMGARGRRWVHEQFAWSRVGAEMYAVYTWVLEGGAAPASVQHV